MRYKTTFFGEIIATPPLSNREMDFLSLFASYKHEERDDVNGGKYPNPNENSPAPLGSSKPPIGQPSWWCGWVSNDIGNIVWNKNTSFLMPVEWFVYILEHFFAEDAFAKYLAPELCEKYSLSSHIFNGTIYAQGISTSDIWRLDVKNNEVFISRVKSIQNGGEGIPSEMEKVEDFKAMDWNFSKRIIYTPTTDEQVVRDKNILNKKLKITFENNKTIKI